MKEDHTEFQSVREALVRHRTAAEAVQHPATLLPLAVCTGSALYLVVLSPILGGAWAAAALVAVAGISAAASFTYRYHAEYTRVAGAVVDRLEAERVRAEEAELAQFGDRIRAGFLSVNSTEGVRVLAGLTASYAQLQASLEVGRSTDALSVSLVPALAGEGYRQALGVLSEALELMKVLHNPAPSGAQEVLWPPEGISTPSPPKEHISEEIGRLQAEIETLKEDPAKAAQLALKQEMLASARQRLVMLDKLQLDCDRLLYQARRCEFALRDAQVELAAVRASGSKTSVDAVIASLQFTIRQVKEVQDELDSLGPRATEEEAGGTHDVGRAS